VVGPQTSEDARFYGLSAKMTKPFTNEGKDLVIQYSVKHEQHIDCGGAYLKLLGTGVDQVRRPPSPGRSPHPGLDPNPRCPWCLVMMQEKFGGDTPYQVMFGPDICGSTKRTHVIFNYPAKKENLLIKDDVRCETDQLTHLYTLHVKPDNTYEVKRTAQPGVAFSSSHASSVPSPRCSSTARWPSRATWRTTGTSSSPRRSRTRPSPSPRTGSTPRWYALLDENGHGAARLCSR
jgi:hypothetical protein